MFLARIALLRASSLLFLTAGVDGQARITHKGRGVNLDMPPSLASLQSPVRVQLKKSSGDICWVARYSTPFTRQDATQF